MTKKILTEKDKEKVSGGAASSNITKFEGEILDVLPNLMFRVRLENGQEITAHFSGKARGSSIKILAGTKVIVSVSPYDFNRGRIETILN